MAVRMGENYVQNGQLTQAGYSALRATETAVEALQAADAALDARVDALEDVAITSAPGTAPLYACRAWVNFNGTGTVAIRASGNVSSITDNGVGNYTVNFTTAMPDADYAVLITSKEDPGVSAPASFIVSQATGSVTIDIRRSTTTAAFDPSIVCVAVFR